MDSWTIWIVIALVCLLIEIFTSGFAVICLSIGALVAAFSTRFVDDVVWQLGVFSFATILSLIFVRPFALRLMGKRLKQSTNADALVGRVGVVTDEIRDGGGRVDIDGDNWRVEMEDRECVVAIGKRVVVVEVRSVVLIVKSV